MCSCEEPQTAPRGHTQIYQLTRYMNWWANELHRGGYNINAEHKTLNKRLVFATV